MFEIAGGIIIAALKNTTVPAYAKYITTIDRGGSRDKTAAQIIYYDYQQDLVVVVADALFDAGTPSNVITSHLKDLETAHVPKGMSHTRYVVESLINETEAQIATLPLERESEHV